METAVAKFLETLGLNCEGKAVLKVRRELELLGTLIASSCAAERVTRSQGKRRGWE